MTNIYRVKEWNKESLLGNPKALSVVFGNKEEMQKARADIMNDRDVIFEVEKDGKKRKSYIPFLLLKQRLYEGDIIFESGED